MFAVDVERVFDEKLRRARRKEQYLRIQACMLTGSHPEAALRLLDRYFALRDDFEHAQAFVDRATAFLTVGRIDHFRWHAARALIAADEGQTALAREEAAYALSAADVDRSPLPYHPALGLVSEEHDELIKKLRSMIDR